MAGSITPDLTVVIPRCAIAHRGCANRTRVSPSSANMLSNSATADLGGADPQSILPVVVMDSGFAHFAPGNDVDDRPHRHTDRIDRDPDVVAACGTHRRDRKDSGIPTRSDDVRDRRIDGISDMGWKADCFPGFAATGAGMDRRRRGTVRVSRAVFPGTALRASGRSRSAELSLAAADRAVPVAGTG